MDRVRPLSRIGASLLTTILFVQSAVPSGAAEIVWGERRRALAASADAVPMPAFASSPRLRRLIARLPTRRVLLRSVHSPQDPNGRVVVLLQDVHRDAGAQRALREAVAALAAGVPVVGLEGASGVIDFHGLREFPRRAAVAAASDYLFRRGEMSGPAHALLRASGPIPAVFGLERDSLYRANIAAYRRAARRADETAWKWRAVDAALARRRAAIPGVVELERRLTAASSLKEKARLLAARVSRAAAVSAFLDAARLEESIHLPAVEREQAAFAGALAGKLSPAGAAAVRRATAAFRTRELTPDGYLTYIARLGESAGISLRRYPALAGYIRYRAAADGLDATAVMRGMREMEARAFDALARDEEDRAALTAARFWALAGRLHRFELTPDEWSAYRTLKARVTGISAEAVSALRAAERFYEIAGRRDGVIAARLLRALRATDAPAAIGVTGGFHTAGLVSRLTEAGVEVAVVAPRFDAASTAGGRALTPFAAAKAPLARLFDAERIFLSPRPYPPLLTAVLVTASATASADDGIRGNEAFQAVNPLSRRIAARVSDEPDGTTVRLLVSGRLVSETVVRVDRSGPDPEILDHAERPRVAATFPENVRVSASGVANREDVVGRAPFREAGWAMRRALLFHSGFVIAALAAGLTTGGSHGLGFMGLHLFYAFATAGAVHALFMNRHRPLVVRYPGAREKSEELADWYGSESAERDVLRILPARPADIAALRLGAFRFVSIPVAVWGAAVSTLWILPGGVWAAVTVFVGAVSFTAMTTGHRRWVIRSLSRPSRIGLDASQRRPRRPGDRPHPLRRQLALLSAAGAAAMVYARGARTAAFVSWAAGHPAVIQGLLFAVGAGLAAAAAFSIMGSSPSGRRRALKRRVRRSGLLSVRKAATYPAVIARDQMGALPRAIRSDAGAVADLGFIPLIPSDNPGLLALRDLRFGRRKGAVASGFVDDAVEAQRAIELGANVIFVEASVLRAVFRDPAVERHRRSGGVLFIAVIGNGDDGPRNIRSGARMAIDRGADGVMLVPRWGNWESETEDLRAFELAIRERPDARRVLFGVGGVTPRGTMAAWDAISDILPRRPDFLMVERAGESGRDDGWMLYLAHRLKRRRARFGAARKTALSFFMAALFFVPIARSAGKGVPRPARVRPDAVTSAMGTPASRQLAGLDADFVALRRDDAGQSGAVDRKRLNAFGPARIAALGIPSVERRLRASRAAAESG